MGGGDTKTVATQQQSTTNPYAPTEPMLQSILTSLGGIGTGVTSGQSDALGLLSREASGIPDLSKGYTGAVTGALDTSTLPEQGMLSDAYGNLTKNIGGTASGAELNPYSTPGFSDAINTMTNDITKGVKGVYAGSGRDPSGAGDFSGDLGRGLTQGIAPVIQSQYNQNKTNQLNSADTLFNAGGATASGLTSEKLAQLNAQFQGLTGGAALPGLLTQPGSTALGVANTAYGLPYQNVGQLEGAVNPIAALGGQTSGTSTQDTTQSKSLLSNILGGATGLAGLNGALGSGWLSSGVSSLGSLLGPSLLFSDERLKEDVTPVGETLDGQTLYSYRYVGEDKPQIGLLAQEVEKLDPDAVVEIGGFKAVDYDRALRRSGDIGMLRMAA